MKSLISKEIKKNGGMIYHNVPITDELCSFLLNKRQNIKQHTSERDSMLRAQNTCHNFELQFTFFRTDQTLEYEVYTQCSFVFHPGSELPQPSPSPLRWATNFNLSSERDG